MANQWKISDHDGTSRLLRRIESLRYAEVADLEMSVARYEAMNTDDSGHLSIDQGINPNDLSIWYCIVRYDYRDTQQCVEQQEYFLSSNWKVVYCKSTTVTSDGLASQPLKVELDYMPDDVVAQLETILDSWEALVFS